MLCFYATILNSQSFAIINYYFEKMHSECVARSDLKLLSCY